jgi:APA family basic amino acid/polyamine antiporter
MLQSPSQLKRQLGLWDTIFMGLGSMIGTGVFVGLGMGAGIAGPAVILAVAIAALVAVCNGLNSAQLAASHPVSGGTYEYGYRYLTPWLGFTAGWMFLLAKTASAATAALGFAGYFLNVIGGSSEWLSVIALVTVGGMTLVVLKGIQRSSAVNTAIVAVTLSALLVFVIGGWAKAFLSDFQYFTPFFQGTNPTQSLQQVLHASALMFVAYTGYGRIATLGEEVRDPQQTIPQAMIVTMGLTMLLYMAVAIAGIATIGASGLQQAVQTQAAPLEVAARTFAMPGSAAVLTVGAMTAMLGVLLNLILGLSRVLLAMGRRRDMPPLVARLNPTQMTPSIAVMLVSSAIAGLVAIGTVKITWSFSAFTVLMYYAITNLAALQLPGEQQRYSRWFAWMGLFACLYLAFWVEWQVWLTGIGLMLAGLGWQRVTHSINPPI